VVGGWAGAEVLALEEALNGARGSPLAPVDPDGLCYLLYTSGSSGRPKGVMMPHGPLLNLIRWQARDSTAGPGDATLQLAPVSFDVSLQEIFSTLATGGRLVCLPAEERSDPIRVWDWIVERRIRRVFVPFVTLEALAIFAGR